MSYRKLLALAVPATLSVAIDPLAATIDTVLIGQKNADWLAPFSSGNAILSTVVFSLNFLIYTVSARVAQAYGQQDPKLLHRETATALAVAVLLGIISMVALIAGKAPLLEGVMELSGPALSQAEDYYLIRLIGLPLALLASAMIGVLRGFQELRATVIIIGAATIVNGVVSLICLYGFGTGVWGAALGTTLSFAASVVIGWFILKRCDPLLRLGDISPLRYDQQAGGLQWVKLDWQDFGRDAKFQLLRSLLLNSTFFTATVLCARGGNLTLGGHQLIYQIMLLVGCFLDGMAVSASTLGGEAIGKTHYRTWWQLATRSLVLATGLSIMLAAIIIASHHEIIALFTADAAMQQHVAAGFHYYIYAIPILGLAYQLDGIMFSGKMFKEAAIGLLIAVLGFYAPTALLGIERMPDTLAVVWLAIGMLGLGRSLTGGYFLWRSAQQDFALIKAYRL